MNKEIIINNKTITVDVIKRDDNDVLFSLNGTEYRYILKNRIDDYCIVAENGDGCNRNCKCVTNKYNSDFFINVDGLEAVFSIPDKRKNRSGADDDASLKSPMPGQIFKILFDIGDKVSKGETILILEAMKMEHAIKSHIDGIITDIFYKEGEIVDSGTELAEVKPLEDTE